MPIHRCGASTRHWTKRRTNGFLPNGNLFSSAWYKKWPHITAESSIVRIDSNPVNTVRRTHTITITNLQCQRCHTARITRLTVTAISLLELFSIDKPMVHIQVSNCMTLNVSGSLCNTSKLVANYFGSPLTWNWRIIGCLLCLSCFPRVIFDIHLGQVYWNSSPNCFRMIEETLPVDERYFGKS